MAVEDENNLGRRKFGVEEQAQFHEEITRDLEEDLILIPEFTEPMRSLHDQQLLTFCLGRSG